MIRENTAMAIWAIALHFGRRISLGCRLLGAGGARLAELLLDSTKAVNPSGWLGVLRDTPNLDLPVIASDKMQYWLHSEQLVGHGRRRRYPGQRQLMEHRPASSSIWLFDCRTALLAKLPRHLSHRGSRSSDRFRVAIANVVSIRACHSLAIIQNLKVI